MKRNSKQINNVVVVSDLHCGCRLGLCPPGGVKLDDGGTYNSSKLQKKVWQMWTEFWDLWVPEVTHGDPYAVVVNGDCIDGVHHGSTTQISHNLLDQQNICIEVMSRIVERADGGLYWVRGTPAHVGQSSVDEERCARALGAVPNKDGQHARYELWKKVGPATVNFMHHVGTTSSSAYESSAIHAELVSAIVEAGRWGEKVPDVVVRSHRHRCIETRMPALDGYVTSFCTAGFQLKTPFSYKIAGGRMAPPQIGGSLIRYHGGELYTRHKVWTIGRPDEE